MYDFLKTVPGVALPFLPEQSFWADFEWADALAGGWRPVTKWGSQGWDLAAWPYAQVAVCHVKGGHGLVYYYEDEYTVWSFTTESELHAEIDKIAERYWRLGWYQTPEDLPLGGLAAHHRGPFHG